MRPLGMWVVALAACGNVPTKKQQVDAAVIVDAPLDAYDCAGHEPDATFTFSPTITPTGNTVTFTPTTPNNSYAWTFPSGSPGASAAESPMVTWATAGTYDVSLSISDANHCLASTMQMITVCTPSAPVGSQALTQTTSGWSNYGIAFTASRDAVLTGFNVSTKGMADTIVLTDDAGTVLQTLAMPATNGTYTAAVSWPLMSGKAYHLVNMATADNLFWSMATFPVPGASVSITSGWGNGGAQGSYWFGFSNLVTCP